MNLQNFMEGYRMIDALRKMYEAEIAHAKANVEVYLKNPVGIGEHPQHLNEIDKLIDKIANAEEKIQVLQQFKL